MKFLLTLVLFVIFDLSFVISAYAVCPVCTIAVGAGLGLSRYFGIDDTISGLWIGGLILSSGLWFADWLRHRGVAIKTSYLNVASCLIFYLAVLIPLYFTSIIGHPYNTIYGFDKLLLGITIGSVVFIFAVSFDKMIRKINGQQLFAFQKVILPIASLIIMSFIFQFALR